MTATLLDGKALAATIEASLRDEVDAVTTASGRPPRLVVVLVGDVAASASYVTAKARAAARVGIDAEVVRAPGSADTAALVGLVRGIARGDQGAVDGILVQLPLPRQVDTTAVLDAVPADLDVDGFHPENAGLLSQGRPRFIPCTAAGVQRLLVDAGIPTAGRRAVIVGRSDIVGKPMALMLLHANATVTICHSRTAGLEDECRRADILVAAIGRPAFIRGSFIKPGAVVIDVGINRIVDRAEAGRIFAADSERLARFDEKGSLVTGDVHPLEVAHAAAFTPVPGGVGPLTIAMLMANTVASAEKRCSA